MRPPGRGNCHPRSPRCLARRPAEANGAQRRDRWKIHRAPEGDPALLYDLATDPGATVDVAARHPEGVAALASEMDRLRATIDPAESIMDRRGLRALDPTHSPSRASSAASSTAAEGADP